VSFDKKEVFIFSAPNIVHPATKNLSLKLFKEQVKQNFIKKREKWSDIYTQKERNGQPIKHNL
jgi:hypothetical protein